MKLLPSVNGRPLDEILADIAGWADLKRARRDQLASFVRKSFQIQHAVAAPTHGPARFTPDALNATIWQSFGARFGMRSKDSFNNFISGCRYALVRLGLSDDKVPLTQAWQALADLLPTKERRMGLVGFMQFCSVNAIAPEAVTADSLDGYELWCRNRQLKADIHGLTRRTASGWNWAAEALPGWPQVRMHRRDMRDSYTIPIEAYPATFQAEVKAYLDLLASDPRETMFSLDSYRAAAGRGRNRPKAAKPRTIETKRDHIRAAAAALVVSNVVSSEGITSLRDLVVPLSRVETIAQFHYERRKKHEEEEAFATRPAHLIGIIEDLRQIAKFHCRLPDDDVGFIAECKVSLGSKVQIQMTEKNRVRLRALLEPNTYAMMINLPRKLMHDATHLWDRAKVASANPGLPPPPDAARTAMFAAAFEILLFCPLRRKNLVGLNLEKELVFDQHTRAIQRLLIMSDKTKTDEMIDWPVPEGSSNLLRVYNRHYRPVLAQSGNPFLFPGEGLSWRNESAFGTELGKLVEQEVGAKFNMHLGRHFAVVRHLRAFPGDYALISRLLGHRKVSTTIAFYSGLEADAAAAKVNVQLEADRKRTRGLAASGFGGRGKVRKAGGGK